MSKYNVTINFDVSCYYEEEIEADSQEEAEKMFKDEHRYLEVNGSVDGIEVNGSVDLDRPSGIHTNIYSIDVSEA